MVKSLCKQSYYNEIGIKESDRRFMENNQSLEKYSLDLRGF